MPRLVFCDEYGNTGANLIDKEQPVFAYAFVVIEQAAVKKAAAAIEKIYRAEGLNPTELKSSTLTASEQGRRRLSAIGRAVGEHGARVALSLVEKRYQICSMIVETYLDPVWCERAPEEMLPAGARQLFADACYDLLNDGPLSEFLAAVREDNPGRIGAIGERFASLLRFHPHPLVSRAARAMETDPERLFRISEPREVLPGQHSPTSQYAAFYPGLVNVNAFLESIGDTGTVVRDYDQQHGAFLELVFSTGQQLHGTKLEAVYRATKLDRLVACEPAESYNEIGIQLADLAAGVFGRAARASLRNGRSAAAARALAASWRPMLLPRSAHYVMVSDARLPAVSSAVLGSAG